MEKHEFFNTHIEDAYNAYDTELAETDLVKELHSKNITISDWNTMVLTLCKIVPNIEHLYKLLPLIDSADGELTKRLDELNVENGAGPGSIQQKSCTVLSNKGAAFGSGAVVGVEANQGFAAGAGSQVTKPEGFAINYYTKAAKRAFAGGDRSVADGECASAMGAYCDAPAYAASANNNNTGAYGPYSTSHGRYTTAWNKAAFASGNSTFTAFNSDIDLKNPKAVLDAWLQYREIGRQFLLAYGEASHALGWGVLAYAPSSFATGERVVAYNPCETAIGHDNEIVEGALLSIGNGTLDKPSNAFVVMEDGRAVVGKGPTDDMDIANKSYVDARAGKSYDVAFDITQTGGYIKLTTMLKSFAVLIDFYADGEAHMSNFRIYCDDWLHGHCVYVDNASNYDGFFPTYTNSYFGESDNRCAWYIPVPSEISLEHCRVYIKGINTSVDDKTCEFVEDVGYASEVTPIRLDKINETTRDIYRYRLMFNADSLTEAMGNGKFKIVNITCEFYSTGLIDKSFINTSGYVSLTKVATFLKNTFIKSNLQCTGTATQLDADGNETNVMLIPITLGTNDSYNGSATATFFNFSCTRVSITDGKFKTSNMALRFFTDNTEIKNGVYVQCSTV